MPRVQENVRPDVQGHDGATRGMTYLAPAAFSGPPERFQEIAMIDTLDLSHWINVEKGSTPVSSAIAAMQFFTQTKTS